MLHTINKSPFGSNSFETSTRFFQPGDPVLFIEDGVYCLLDGSLKLASSNIHVLQPDADTRGLSGRISPEIQRADYKDFVQLCCDADSVCNWF